MKPSSPTQWHYKVLPNREDIEELTANLNTSRITSTLLWQRGIRTFEEARVFFTPTKQHLLNPWLMKGMAEAVERVQKALQQQENIIILGDYDVDGTTATAVAYGVLKDLGARVTAYQPERLTEGYGITRRAIQEAYQKEVKLIISVDCGISAALMVDEAKALGMDFIVVDHHLPNPATTPQAAIILNPKQDTCFYPYKDLSGCGLAFKFMQAICEQLGADEFLLDERLDLVALSIAADIVPLTGENRVLCALGLEKLAQRPNLGIKALMRSAGQGKTIAVNDLVFKLSPLINAPGRMGSAKEALALLMAKSSEEAEKIAMRLFKVNQDRKNAEREVCEAAFKQALNYANCSALVLCDPNWHRGVLGIVASRCVDKFRKPTIVLGGDEGILVGSGRTLPNLPLYDALADCSEYLNGFGGHAYAAGVQLQQDKLEDFRTAFTKKIESREFLEDLLRPKLIIDLAIDSEELKPKTINVINRMGPFGPDLMRPVLSCAINKALDVAVFKGQHLWVKVKLADTVFEAIGFGMADLAGVVSQGMFEMAFSISERLNTQLDLKGIRPCAP